MSDKYISRDNLELAIDGLKVGMTPNWNENDKSAVGYIENRPFYTEYGVIVDNYSGSGKRPKCNFVVGNVYDVIWNGVTYKGLVCHTVDGYSSYIGGSGYPFYIDDNGGNGFYVEPENGFTVSVLGDIVHQLDEKYIPDSVTRYIDVISDNTTKISDNTKKISDNTTKISDNTKKISDNTKKINTLNSNLNALEKETMTYESVRTIIPYGHWSDMAYGGGRFVAVGRAYDAASSTDGVTWTSVKLPSVGGWMSITYGNNKFVAVGRESKVAYSDNGKVWGSATLPTPMSPRAIAYGNNKFVVVGNGIGANVNIDKVAYSTDGITWAEATLPFSDEFVHIAYGDGKFVAIANNTDKAAYSTDGITWTEVTLPFSGKWEYIIYGDGKFVAFDRYIYNDKAAYSTDGITWTEVTLPYTGSPIATYGNGKFVAIFYGQRKVAYSTDGITWTEVPVTSYCKAICYGNDMFVAIVANDEVIYSEDGINWHTGYERIVQDGNIITDNIKDIILPISNTTQVGQTIVVKSVDENGKPIEWEAVDMPSGSTSNTEFILNSSTEGSTKQFKITIDDTGTLIVSEIVAGEAE